LLKEFSNYFKIISDHLFIIKIIPVVQDKIFCKLTCIHALHCNLIITLFVERCFGYNAHTRWTPNFSNKNALSITEIKPRLW